MKPTELLKAAAIAALTSGILVGCQQAASESDSGTTAQTEEECQGATPEVRNAIYAAKLKNARARNLGAEWEETAKIIEEAEAAAEETAEETAETAVEAPAEEGAAEDAAAAPAPKKKAATKKVAKKKVAKKKVAKKKAVKKKA